MKKLTTVTVLECKDIRLDIPENPIEFLEFWKNKIDLIPKKYLDVSKIELDAMSYYEDSIILSLEISYEREETDEEYKTRRKEEKIEADEIKLKELKLRDELNAKYRD